MNACACIHGCMHVHAFMDACLADVRMHDLSMMHAVPDGRCSMQMHAYERAHACHACIHLLLFIERGLSFFASYIHNAYAYAYVVRIHSVCDRCTCIYDAHVRIYARVNACLAGDGDVRMRDVSMMHAVLDGRYGMHIHAYEHVHTCIRACTYMHMHAYIHLLRIPLFASYIYTHAYFVYAKVCKKHASTYVYAIRARVSTHMCAHRMHCASCTLYMRMCMHASHLA
jgi:hypothetical protein